MEMKGDKKNWVMYTEWTNQEQQRWWKEIVELESDDEDVDTKLGDEGM
jgi:hypothetical protein